MNEEELKKGCGKRQGRGLNFYICGHLLLNVLCPTCQARLEGFQKGKLEQKKEELKFLLEIKGELSSLVATKQLFLSGYNKLIFIQARIKQLQKEIGRGKTR